MPTAVAGTVERPARGLTKPSMCVDAACSGSVLTAASADLKLAAIACRRAITGFSPCKTDSRDDGHDSSPVERPVKG